MYITLSVLSSVCCLKNPLTGAWDVGVGMVGVGVLVMPAVGEGDTVLALELVMSAVGEGDTVLALEFGTVKEAVIELALRTAAELTGGEELGTAIELKATVEVIEMGKLGTVVEMNTARGIDGVSTSAELNRVVKGIKDEFGPTLELNTTVEGEVDTMLELNAVDEPTTILVVNKAVKRGEIDVVVELNTAVERISIGEGEADTEVKRERIGRGEVGTVAELNTAVERLGGGVVDTVVELNAVERLGGGVVDTVVERELIGEGEVDTVVEVAELIGGELCTVSEPMRLGTMFELSTAVELAPLTELGAGMMTDVVAIGVDRRESSTWWLITFANGTVRLGNWCKI